MAKSIFEILDTLETETSVPAVGRNVEHTIPRSQFPTAAQFESPELLEQWARETGNMHKALQAGVQKRLIDIRAIFKSEKKGETWTPESGQAKVDSSEWTVTTRPKTGNKVATAIDTLSKLTPEQLAVIMAQIKAAQGQPE
jgi:hypothetical protein